MSVRALLLSSIALSLAACAAPSGGDSPSDVEVTSDEVKTANDLSPAQEKLVLKLVDDICGDTWCEGDFNFFFAKMKCSFAAKSCTITMKIIEREDGTGATPRELWRSCKMRGVAGFTSMVDTAPNGYQSLDPAFYDKLTTCVDKLEKTIPPR